MLGAAILLAIVLRVAAMLVLDQPLRSDALSRFVMAAGLAERGVLADQYGQHLFHTPGYALLLAPFFRLLGSSVPVALGVNLLLAGAGTWLVYRLAIALSGSRAAGLVAAFVNAVWLPGIWNATHLAKENLSVPLAVAVALCAVCIARGERPLRMALLAGLLWGASLLTGGSALPFCIGIAIALAVLWRQSGQAAPALRAALCFVVGTMLTLGPWLYAADRMVGRPILTTNGAFNLYLGNNPAATGRFMSIADTPLGKDWNATRKRLGEVANADRLQAVALRWIADNPGRAARLAALKLAWFWGPNIPSAADPAMSPAMFAARLLEVVQYLVILVLALLAFRSWRIPRPGKWILASMVIGFWLLHAAAYIIPRYRDPVMALLIAVMAVPLAAYLARHLPGFLPQPPQPAFLPARREGSWYAPHANARRSASAPLMR